MSFQLSERQQVTVASALTILAACVILVAVGTLFWLLAVFFARFSNVFLPLAVAAVAALVFRPYYSWLRTKLRLAKVAALAAVFLSAMIPLTAFCWFFGDLVVDQLSALIAKVPEWWQAGVALVKERAPQVVEFVRRHQILQKVEGQQDKLVDGIQIFGAGALTAGAGLLKGVGKALGWVVLPVYFSFFLLMERKRLFELDRLLPFLKEETRQDVVYLVQEFVNIIVAFFRGQLIVAFLQGLLFAIGFSIVGLKYGFVLGLVLGFLNIIPYLGSIVGLGVALPLAFFQHGGGILQVVWVLLVFTIVQIIEGYLLTPKIMGDRTGLHPMAIIVAVFFWGSALGGIMGMIMAIPLTAFLVVFWRLAEEKYVQELV
jgi:predicted PurR-regulated permease PerM